MSGLSRITVDSSRKGDLIAPELYGHFSEQIGGVFYGGLWAGEDSPVETVNGFRRDAVEAFRRLSPPVLRWPGGCFAETYDWRDGIGPRSSRPRRVNWWYYHDGRVEPNQVGTHEFIDLCRLTGAEPYFAANMTSVSPLHIRNWIEYCNFPAGTTSLADERARNGSPEPFGIRYWGIGNENWGGGGQMTADQCAREFIRFTTVCRSVIDEDTRFIMCGADGHDLSWTEGLLREWASRGGHETPAWGVSIHYYTSNKDTPQTFTEDGWYETMFKGAYMKRVLDDHRTVMDRYDPERKLKIVLDEWGNWHREGSGPSKGYNLFEQQSNMRDAVLAAMTLNLFNERSSFVGMANLAQICNNLHCLFLSDGIRLITTPTYHVFDLYKGHMGGRYLRTVTQCGQTERKGYEPLDTISASASEKDGMITLTIANTDVASAKEIELEGIRGQACVRSLSCQDPHTCNTFEAPNAVTPRSSELPIGEGTRIIVPAASVTALTIRV